MALADVYGINQLTTPLVLTQDIAFVTLDPCSNGTNQLYGWGSNNTGQLGYNSSILPSGVITPTPIPNMNNVKYYSTGYNMGAIKNDSSGWVWGSAIGCYS
jgi:alpha-tubulin suppressor-like RCC1 family protein